MMKKYFFLWTYIVLLLIFFSACGDSSDETPNESPIFETEAEFKDVAYANVSAAQKYDIFLPKNRSASKTKVIVLIHGGGWVEGDKQDMSGIYDYLKTSTPEYAIANINYRLAGFNTKPFPMQTDDIASMVAHLKSKSSEYGILPEFAFVGISAGAHLSLLYSYKFDANKDVKVVCDVVGPTDFLHDSYVNSQNPETQQIALAMQLLVGKIIDTDPDYFKSISPRYAATAQVPPTIMFYAGNDNLVPEEQGLALQQTLNGLNVKNEYYFYPQDEHIFTQANILDALIKATVFIKANL